VPNLPLAGARIALTGTRKAQETADFVRRLGGVPIVAPALDTTSIDGGDTAADPVSTLRELLETDVALVIFLTGVGARALLRLAESAGRADDLRSTLAKTKVVARGPKALGALKGKLHRRAARVIELDLYRHVAPANEAPVLDLIDAIEANQVDFLTFTSAIAVREFFALAERHGRDDELLAALNRQRPVPVAVGPVTAAALTEAGILMCLSPAIHTTGGMFRAIEEWIATNSVVDTPQTVDSPEFIK
jgi:uroporphyrinogen-III synthase